jgi:hypothetical protein
MKSSISSAIAIVVGVLSSASAQELASRGVASLLDERLS